MYNAHALYTLRALIPCLIHDIHSYPRHQVYGMVDHEQLSHPEELSKGKVLQSRAWGLAKAIVLKDWSTLDEENEAHFHNYDRMEVWGLV